MTKNNVLQAHSFQTRDNRNSQRRRGIAVWVMLSTATLGLNACGNSEEVLDSSGSRPLETLGPFLTRAEVKGHVRNAGFPAHLHDTMVRIGECESSLGTNSFAWGGGNRHTGIFQISDLHKSACGYGGSSLDTFRVSMTNPAKNAACAFVVYRNAGNSLTPWDCY